MSNDGSIARPAHLLYLAFAQATSPLRLEPQMLIILDQVAHGVMRITPRTQIPSVD